MRRTFRDGLVSVMQGSDSGPAVVLIEQQSLGSLFVHLEYFYLAEEGPIISRFVFVLGSCASLCFSAQVNSIISANFSILTVFVLVSRLCLKHLEFYYLSR